jgi:phosphoribosylformimino-5-aminoimidazole carboxamide ribotide isomerase
MQGHVVHARHGNRQHYQPIQSKLCASSKALDVVQGLLALYPFQQLYIADVDAIRRRGHHREIVIDNQQHYPQLDIWLDAGIGNVDDLNAWQALGAECIIASESLRNMDDYLELRARGAHAILSLDFTAQGYQGPRALLDEPECWPEKIIAMTLQQVGSNAGPDIKKLTQIMDSVDRKIYAAGGVRDISDIHALKNMGLSGVLVASALHAGNLTRAELESISFIAG